jgi:hypothetical protein
MNLKRYKSIVDWKVDRAGPLELQIFIDISLDCSLPRQTV